MSSRQKKGAEQEIPERRPARATSAREPLESVASATGNRGFGIAVARMRDGEGILPGGVVHPDVEAAIKASQGQGRPLEPGVRKTLEERLGAPLDDVRIHTDDQAAALARSVSARAFTVGSDIYFSDNEHQAGGSEPSALVTHEVAHVLQQRGAALTGPLTVTQPDDPTELEAEAIARDVTA